MVSWLEMGNKQGSRRRESGIVQPQTTSAMNPSLSPEAAVILTNCLNKLPLVLDKNVQDEVIRRVEIRETEEISEHLLEKGDEPLGIFVLVSGNVIVVSENQKFVLREIQVGDCFGEVSVLFDTRCTADVCTKTRCVMLLLKTSDARQLFTIPTEVTLLEWFKQRRYFDTSKLFGDQQLAQEIAVSILQQSPVLQGWRSEALKAVVNSLKQGIIVLYPAGSIIVREGWKGQEMFILVHGVVKFSTGNQELATFGAGERGFCFGEEGFFTGTERRTTVRAVVPCQVITLRQENFYDAVSEFTAEKTLLCELCEKWKRQVNLRDEEVYYKYGGALDLEILRMTLKQTEEFGACPPGFLYVLALSMVIKEIEANEALLTESEYQNGGLLFVVLQGSAVVLVGEIRTDRTVKLKEVFWKSQLIPDKGWVKAEELCVAAFFPEEALEEAKNAFPGVFLSIN